MSPLIVTSQVYHMLVLCIFIGTHLAKNATFNYCNTFDFQTLIDETLSCRHFHHRFALLITTVQKEGSLSNLKVQSDYRATNDEIN